MSTEIAICPKRCDCRTCRACGKRRGWITRQRLLDKAAAGVIRIPALLTLTVDRTRFASPEAAYEHVTGGKFIPTLMRKLGVKWWVSALEFQSKTGDGWPHWHVLIDKADLPTREVGGERVPHCFHLPTVWKLWREGWGIGGCDLGLPGDCGRNPDPQHAIMYMTKQPKAGYPSWVLKRKKRTRFIAASKAVGPLVAWIKEGEEDAPPDPDDGPGGGEGEPDDQGEEAGAFTPLIDRMAACGESSDVFSERADPDTGELRRQYVGTLPISPSTLAAASAAGLMRVDVREGRDRWDRPRYWSPGSFASLRDEAFHVFTKADARLRRRVADNRRRLLDDNLFARRLAGSGGGVHCTPASDGRSRAGVSDTPAAGGDLTPDGGAGPPVPSAGADGTAAPPAARAGVPPSPSASDVLFPNFHPLMETRYE